MNRRLNLAMGVSAQISLNSTPVSANGAGVSLNQLMSQTILNGSGIGIWADEYLWDFSACGALELLK
ncbi:TPA: hypothetical protein U2M59_003001 [Providencia stuartii]|nr:hypothetical protein [Providencia stuartii]